MLFQAGFVTALTPTCTLLLVCVFLPPFAFDGLYVRGQLVHITFIG